MTRYILGTYSKLYRRFERNYKTVKKWVLRPGLLELKLMKYKRGNRWLVVLVDYTSSEDTFYTYKTKKEALKQVKRILTEWKAQRFLNKAVKGVRR